MSYEFYKIIHILGLILLFFGFGGLLLTAYAKIELPKKARVMGFVTHGIGLLFIIVSGFGMAARLGLMTNLPTWIKAKVGIWALLGVSISLVKRKGYVGWPVAILLWGLGVSAAIIAINKPF
ncbi:MAG: hypothetical protein ACXVCY_10300 [Pseudobdellovibrionaceae bacterium]